MCVRMRGKMLQIIFKEFRPLQGISYFEKHFALMHKLRNPQNYRNRRHFSFIYAVFCAQFVNYFRSHFVFHQDKLSQLIYGEYLQLCDIPHIVNFFFLGVVVNSAFFIQLCYFSENPCWKWYEDVLIWRNSSFFGSMMKYELKPMQSAIHIRRFAIRIHRILFMFSVAISKVDSLIEKIFS